MNPLLCARFAIAESNCSWVAALMVRPVLFWYPSTLSNSTASTPIDLALFSLAESSSRMNCCAVSV